MISPIHSHLDIISFLLFASAFSFLFCLSLCRKRPFVLFFAFPFFFVFPFAFPSFFIFLFAYTFFLSILLFIYLSLFTYIFHFVQHHVVIVYHDLHQSYLQYQSHPQSLKNELPIHCPHLHNLFQH